MVRLNMYATSLSSKGGNCKGAPRFTQNSPIQLVVMLKGKTQLLQKMISSAFCLFEHQDLCMSSAAWDWHPSKIWTDTTRSSFGFGFLLKYKKCKL